MKRFTLAFFLLLAITSNAQPGMFRPERLNDEEVIQMQVRDIVYWLGLDGETRDKFILEYTAFKKEIDAVAKGARAPQEIKSEAEIEKAILNNFAVSEQILQIRKRYYSRFSEFMKPSQIQKMYRIENEAARRLLGGPSGPEGPEGHRHHPLPPRPDNARCD